MAHATDTLTAHATDTLATCQTDTLREVEVLAQRGRQSLSTSYRLARKVLDHHQTLNLTGVLSLLPGGKTVNATLIDDGRIALRASTAERGNASAGTAIEVDGVRIEAGARMDETNGASVRHLSTSSVESIEVITGVASVEYGDMSNGVVRVNTRRGESPLIIEASTNPYTKQIALNKGFTLYHHNKSLGIVNASAEHARSYTNLTSPHTSYQRWCGSLAYTRNMLLRGGTLTLGCTVSGNIGGYDSKADPDAFSQTYQKVRDNNLHLSMSLGYRLALTERKELKLDLQTDYTASDLLSSTNTNRSASSSQPALHTMHDGYAIAQEYDGTHEGSEGQGGIVLCPTGYWYELAFHDQKPKSWHTKLKCQLTGTNSNLLLGGEYKGMRNDGRGTYYDDMALAPTWRPYVYSELPTLHNIALFAEEQLSIATSGHSVVKVQGGVRDDITVLRGSGYGVSHSLSPRANLMYELRLSDATLAVHAGYGRGVKLPSFEVLYPPCSYVDRLAFTPGSTSDNRAFYAYHTFVSKVEANRHLRWQYTNQFDMGVEGQWRGARLSMSLFYHQTRHPYQLINVYTPASYQYTSQAALEGIAIPTAERIYGIDGTSGQVTVTSAATGESVALPSTTYYTYNQARRYINGDRVERYGVEWMLDLPSWRLGRGRDSGDVTLRLDGNYYHYRGLDQTLFAGTANGVRDATTPDVLIGYYRGSNATNASTVMTASASQGTLTKQCNLNTTVTLRLPRLRLIATLRVESTLLNYRRALANKELGRPAYYSTWSRSDCLIPFESALAEAIAMGDTRLASNLQALIKQANTTYYYDAQRLSAYHCCNLSVTKEIGRQLSISFYANNFINSTQRVRNSQTHYSVSVYGSGYIPRFYYGMSLRVKI